MGWFGIRFKGKKTTKSDSTPIRVQDLRNELTRDGLHALRAEFRSNPKLALAFGMKAIGMKPPSTEDQIWEQALEEDADLRREYVQNKLKRMGRSTDPIEQLFAMKETLEALGVGGSGNQEQRSGLASLLTPEVAQMALMTIGNIVSGAQQQGLLGNGQRPAPSLAQPQVRTIQSAPAQSLPSPAPTQPADEEDDTDERPRRRQRTRKARRNEDVMSDSMQPVTMPDDQSLDADPSVQDDPIRTLPPGKALEHATATLMAFLADFRSFQPEQVAQYVLWSLETIAMRADAITLGKVRTVAGILNNPQTGADSLLNLLGVWVTMSGEPTYIQAVDGLKCDEGRAFLEAFCQARDAFLHQMQQQQQGG